MVVEGAARVVVGTIFVVVVAGGRAVVSVEAPVCRMAHLAADLTLETTVVAATATSSAPSTSSHGTLEVILVVSRKVRVMAWDGCFLLVVVVCS